MLLAVTLPRPEVACEGVVASMGPRNGTALGEAPTDALDGKRTIHATSGKTATSQTCLLVKCLTLSTIELPLCLELKSALTRHRQSMVAPHPIL